MSTIHERRLARMPSAQQVVHNASDFKSPLAHVRNMAQSLPSTTGEPGPSSLAHRQSPSSTPPKTVPALDFNLFRSNSVYSVSSINTISSFDTTSDDAFTRPVSMSSDITSSEEDEVHPSAVPMDFGQRADTPTTPKADRTQYFDLGPPVAAGPGPSSHTDELASGQITPKRSFFVRSRAGLTNIAPPPPPAPPPPAPAFLTSADFYKTGPSTSSRLLSETHHDVFTPPPRSTSRARSDSITREGEISALHPQRQSIGLEDWESVHGEQGSEWGDDEEGFEWLDTDGAHAANGTLGARANMSPGKRLAKLRDAVPGFGSSSAGGEAASVGGTGRKLKKRHIVLPSRAAPPPPPGPGSPRQSNSTPASSSAPNQHPPHVHNNSRRAPIPGHISLPNIRVHKHHSPASGPTMVPLRDPSMPNPTLSRLKPSNPRASAMSMQSNAFSIYVLDGGASSPSADTPRASTPGGTELVFPKGTYTKVPASVLNRQDDAEARRRGISEPHRQPPMSPLLDPRESSRDDLLTKGVEARGKGDLPKAAWYFRQAADAGSSTGRIYYGLALRHGWGVAKDERKAFAELRTACDKSIAQGSKEVPGSSDGEGLSIQQKKAMARDISLGMFEVANCFLEGVGVKKDPEVAVSYLRFAGDLGDLASQEQLGFLLSKGGNGIKKDMKEAAKWYRMAIGQGTTTMGLAWVWKEKYMT